MVHIILRKAVRGHVHVFVHIHDDYEETNCQRLGESETMQISSFVENIIMVVAAMKPAF